MQQQSCVSHKAHITGFTLVELIAVLIVVGVLAAMVGSRMISQTTFQLQAGRDLLTTALFSAQQKAMVQLAPVRVLVSGSTIDIRLDMNGDGNFSNNESVYVAGSQYPLVVDGGVIFSTHSFDYNHLGHTTPAVISVGKGEQSIQVTVTATGYVY